MRYIVITPMRTQASEHLARNVFGYWTICLTINCLAFSHCKGKFGYCIAVRGTMKYCDLQREQKGCCKIVILQHPTNQRRRLPHTCGRLLLSFDAILAGKSSFDAIWRQNVGAVGINRANLQTAAHCATAPLSSPFTFKRYPRQSGPPHTGRWRLPGRENG